MNGGPNWGGAPCGHTAETKSGRLTEEAVLVVQGVGSFGNSGSELGNPCTAGFGLGVGEHGCGRKSRMVVGDGEVAESR